MSTAPAEGGKGGGGKPRVAKVKGFAADINAALKRAEWYKKLEEESAAQKKEEALRKLSGCRCRCQTRPRGGRPGGGAQGCRCRCECVWHLTQRLDAMKKSIEGKTMSARDPSLPLLVRRIAVELEDDDRLDEAEGMFRELVSLERGADVDWVLKTATALCKLGGVVLLRGGVEEAKDLLEESVCLHRSLRQDNTRDLACALHGCGKALASLGRDKDALDRYEEALDMYRKVLGDEHENVADVLESIGHALTSQSKLQKAVKIMEQALKIRKRVLGEGSCVAVSLLDLGGLYTEQGLLDQATTALKEGLTIARRIQGQKSCMAAHFLDSMAAVTKAEGRYKDALEEYKEVHRILLVSRGKDHEDVAATLYHKALVHEVLADQDSALDCLREAHRIHVLRGLSYDINESSQEGEPPAKGAAAGGAAAGCVTGKARAKTDFLQRAQVRGTALKVLEMLDRLQHWKMGEFARQRDLRRRIQEGGEG